MTKNQILLNYLNAEERGYKSLGDIYANYSDEKWRALYFIQNREDFDFLSFYIINGNCFFFNCAYINKEGSLVYDTAKNTYIIDNARDKLNALKESLGI